MYENDGTEYERDGIDHALESIQNKSLRQNIRETLFGSWPSRIATTAVGAVAIGATFVATCTDYVKPNEIGVRQTYWSVTGNSGIEQGNLQPGYHIALPTKHKIHKFPRDTQILDLSRNHNGSVVEEDYRGERAAHIQTSDGFFVDLDVSILYRIDDAHKVLTSIGAGKLYEDNGIVPKAEPVLKATLGQLNPEDMYNVTERLAKQADARDELNTLLADKGLYVEQVLVRYPEFHRTLQDRIEAKVLREQEVERNIAQTAEAEAKARLSDIVALGEQQASIQLQKGTAYETQRRGEQERYVREQRSEGDKLVALAQAEKKRLINEAYNGPGADLLVGLRMAEVLNGLQAIVVPAGGDDGFNPLYLDEVVDQLGGAQQTTTGGDNE